MIEFVETRRNWWWLLAVFLRELNDILDQSKPLPRRAGMLFKWTWLMRGLGYSGEPLDSTSEVTDDVIEEKVKDILKWVASIIKQG